MYLARFEAPGGEILQAALSLRIPAGDAGSPADLSEALLPGLVDGASFALRTQIAERATHRVLLLSYHAPERPSLEALVDKLCSLPGVDAIPCSSQAQHDELSSGFPSARQAWVRPGSYRAGEYLLASDFRLFSAIDPIFLAALDRGWGVAYQINVLRRSIPREDLRWLKKQLVRMELHDAFPGSLYDLQRSIVDRLPEMTYLLDEVVGCGDEQAWDYLTRVVDEEFALRMRRYGFSESPLEEGPVDLLQDSIATGFQLEMLQESDPVVRAAASVKSEQIQGILRWALHSGVSDPESRFDAGRPPRTEIDAFISYSSPDRQTAFAVCRELESQGLTCWIAPRDVGTGVSYPDAIMRGLRATKALVLIFSAHANASPYVEREVERAVSLRTPVLTLRLADIPPTGSLEYLISTTHWQESEDPPRAEDMECLAGAVARIVRPER